MTDELKEEILEMVRIDRRRNKNLQQWAVIIALAIQFGGFIWQASKMSTTQESQQVWMNTFAGNLSSVTNSVALLATQVAVNANDISNLKQQVERK